jgi:Tfp pilus assembly protein PilF
MDQSEAVQCTAMKTGVDQSEAVQCTATKTGMGQSQAERYTTWHRGKQASGDVGSLFSAMSIDPTQMEAIRSFRVALHFHQVGEIDRAVFHYLRSLELRPSAEAHAFLGWAYSFQGELEKAIEECIKAIEIDPEFSNPYNDIGAYLIEQGNAGKAVTWLEQALQAPRCESFCYPHFNLGRAHEMLGDPQEAERSYRRALDADPTFVPAQLGLAKLSTSDDGEGPAREPVSNKCEDEQELDCF